MKSPKTYMHRQSGFTLIELIIAMAIMTILGGLVLFIGFDQYRSYSLSSERDVVVVMLQKARNQAMNNINEAPHGLRILSSGYVVFQGASYALRNPQYDEVIPKSPGITTGGVQEFVFKQLRGDMAAGVGDATISNTVKTHTISVNSEGRINW